MEMVALGISALGAVGQVQSASAAAEAQESQAKFRANIRRRNALNAALENRFQQSVERFNRADIKQRTGEELEVLDDRFEREQAMFRASSARRTELSGSFSDVLRSRSLDFETQRSRKLRDGAQAAFETGVRERNLGNTSRNRIRFARSEAANIRRIGASNAAATRSAGVASAVGTIGSGIATFNNSR